MLTPLVYALSLDDRFQVSTRDWHRLRIVLGTPGAAANLDQLRAIMRSVLVCSEQEGRTFDRRFDEFFDFGLAEPIDIHAAIDDLGKLIAMPVATGVATPVEIAARKTRAPSGDLAAAVPAVEEIPTVELIDEQPLLLDMDDEQLGPWLDEVPPAEFDPQEPTYFSMGLVCRQREPMLGDSQLQEAADSLGFFRSATFSSRLDTPRSIAATLERGGLPTPRFEKRRKLLSVALLLDQSARDLRLNTVPQELAAGLRRRGVSVFSYVFHGLPLRFVDARGRMWDIDDLEEMRRELIVLLVTDGHGMYRQVDRRPLERMSRWPRVALLDPRPAGLPSLLPDLGRQYRLPVYPCDELGLIDCLWRFTSESGSVGRPADLPTSGRRAAVVRGHYPDDESFLRDFLSPDQLDFAQACALVPVISLGLADRLRSKFFPNLRPSTIDRLLAVPGTRLTWAGIGFDGLTRDSLLRGFQQQNIAWQREVACFLTTHVKDTMDELGRGRRTGLAALQGRCQVEMIRSLIVDHPVDVQDLVRIWKLTPLSDSTDAAVEAVLDRIQSKPLRRVAESRLRVAERASDKPRGDRTPENLARIPAGQFWMGDPSERGDGDERPRHQVYVSEFLLEKKPVTWSLWQRVCAWAVEHGYEFDNPGAGKGEDHPVQTVNWYDAVKWCNARSEMEGLKPCYYEDSDRQRRYHGGQVDLEDACVDWTANGYRLPTEAEWEKAARGGLEGQHYPWESPTDQDYEDLISEDRASYGGKLDGTSPVGNYAANGYGLSDMSGNVREWCWDAWDGKWYSKPEAATADTHGPDAPVKQRVYRGGGWADGARFLRCSFRVWYPPGYRDQYRGFRVARGRVGPAGSERVDEAEARDEPTAEETSERSSPRLGRVLFVGGPPDRTGEVTLTATRDVSESHAVPLGTTEELPSGAWQATFAVPGFETTTAKIEARAFYQRTYRANLQPIVPENLARISAGEFWMGDPSEQGAGRERPRHRVSVSEFFLEKEPVTWSLWQRVYAWAVEHGYEFGGTGAGNGENHPAQTVTWYDAVRWCNARSEMEGLQPCCYEDAEHRDLYRRAQQDLESAFVDWQADGYRLPTEAEWEKAARGGLEGQHYPWESPADEKYENYISPDQANYAVKLGGTSPVDKYPANGYGLHDMSGNVWEWCWDVWDEGWYGKSDARSADTHGPPAPAKRRVFRGGGWANDARYLRCSYRSWIHPGARIRYQGFRVARGRVGPGGGERVAEAEARDEPSAEATSERSVRGAIG